jgi:hypothetical protein
MGFLSTLEVKILDGKVVLDLLLDERVCYAKFGYTGSYRAQLHKEQTNNPTNKQSNEHTNKQAIKQTYKQTFFFIY